MRHSPPKLDLAIPINLVAAAICRGSAMAGAPTGTPSSTSNSFTRLES